MTTHITISGPGGHGLNGLANQILDAIATDTPFTVTVASDYNAESFIDKVIEINKSKTYNQFGETRITILHQLWGG